MKRKERSQSAKRRDSRHCLARTRALLVRYGRPSPPATRENERALAQNRGRAILGLIRHIRWQERLLEEERRNTIAELIRIVRILPDTSLTAAAKQHSRQQFGRKIIRLAKEFNLALCTLPGINNTEVKWLEGLTD